MLGPDDSSVLLSVGRTIKAARTLTGMTQASLAGAVGISQNHLSNVEAGKREPGILLLIRLSDALGVPPTTILVSALKIDPDVSAEVNRPLDALRRLVLETLEAAAETRPTRRT